MNFSPLFLVLVSILLLLIILPGLGIGVKPMETFTNQQTNFYDSAPNYNYNYLLGQPYGYYYQYPFSDEGRQCRIFPYVYSYTTGQEIDSCLEN